MARLIDGYERSRIGVEPIGERLFRLGVVTALFHDVGYLRRSDEATVKNGAEFTLVHVSRGASFLQAFTRIGLVPDASVGHIGLYRNDETLNPMRYYVRLPKDIGESQVVLCDPMLATGGSAVEAINILKTDGARQELPVPLKKILANKAEDQLLADGDILFIPSSTAKNALNEMESILPSASGAAIYRVP